MQLLREEYSNNPEMTAFEDLRHELFNWLKNKNLDISTACYLLESTGMRIKKTAMKEPL
jgi:hypothetical protein